MTRNETATLLTAMMAIFSNLHFNDIELALNSWQAVLEPYDGQQVKDAFSVYARTDTSGFAPTPGKLIAMIEERADPGLTDGEIIGMLTRAASNATYGYEKEYAALPPLLQKAVGSATTLKSWGQMAPDQLNYPIGQILKAYRIEQNRQKQTNAAEGLSIGRRSVEELAEQTAARLTGKGGALNEGM